MNVLDKKLERNKRNIAKGDLSTVRYFQSKIDPSQKGSLGLLPSAVVGVGHQFIKKYTTDTLHSLPFDEGRKRLAHTIGTMMREEIIAQLDEQIVLATKVRSKSVNDAEKHEHVLKKLHDARKDIATIFNDVEKKAQQSSTPQKLDMASHHLDPTYRHLSADRD